MEEQLVSLRVALCAHTKGFNWECREVFDLDRDSKTLLYFEGDAGFLSNDKLNREHHYFEEFICTRPSQSLLAKWLRDVHNIEVMAMSNSSKSEPLGFWWLVGYINEEPLDYLQGSNLKTYEEALEIGLIKGLELIK